MARVRRHLILALLASLDFERGAWAAPPAAAHASASTAEFEKALAMKEKTLGPAHPDVAVALNTLASAFKDKGDFARAESLYTRHRNRREGARTGESHGRVAARQPRALVQGDGEVRRRGAAPPARPQHRSEGARAGPRGRSANKQAE